MALPSLPNIQQSLGGWRIPGNVPPTPTRIALRSNLAATSSTSTHAPPPHASAPISTMLVPQTPVSRRHDGRASSSSSTSSSYTGSAIANIHSSRLLTRCSWTMTSRCQPDTSHQVVPAMAICHPHSQTSHYTQHTSRSPAAFTSGHSH